VLGLVGQAESHRRHLDAPVPGQWRAGIRSLISRQWSNPLSRGGLALLVNTGLTGVLGFAYWIIAARLSSTYAVGVAGALVAASTLFSGLGQLNMSGMLMRFLPKAGGKSRRLVLLTYAFAACASALLATISLVGIRFLASPSSPLRLDRLESTIFVLAVAATAIFTIQDSVLIGLRKAVWVPVENGTFGVAKIGLLVVLAPVAGTAFIIFNAWMIPLTLTIPVISAVLFSRFLPRRPGRRRMAYLGGELRSKLIRFAIGDAAGGLFTQTWTYLLPVIITASLGASVNALFYTSYLFSSTIDQVAANYASPLTVEGAHAPEEIAGLIRSAIKHIFAIVLPVVTFLIIICPWLLHAFGDKYVAAVPLLRLLLVACLPKAIAILYYAYCRVERSTHKSAWMQGYVCIATLCAVVFLSRSFGLVGVGFAIVSIQASAAAICAWALRRGLRGSGLGGRQGRHRRPRHEQASAIGNSLGSSNS
jgi:O-antigen/teichoic acid export membrane protein